jgi:hypothetical protein
MLKKINQILWAIFLFTFPLSIRFVVYENAGYRFGNFNPWVTGFFYLPEILLGIVFILWLITESTSIKSKISALTPHEIKRKGLLLLLLLLFLVNAGIMTFLKGDPALFGFFSLRALEAVIISTLIINQLLPEKTVVSILLGGAVFQMVWGWIQWRLNHSLGLNLLGESTLGPDVSGVAKIDLPDGGKQIRPYGSFLHPNILATYLMVIMFISLAYLKKYKYLMWLIILTGGIYFTHSTAAAVAVLMCFALMAAFSYLKDIQNKKLAAGIVLVILFLGSAWFFVNSSSVKFGDTSWQERLNQNQISRDMFYANPFGVGIGNYTLEMEQFPNCGTNSGTNCGNKLLPWEFQPVHNVYFLVLNETGIQGLAILLLAMYLIFYMYWQKGCVLPLIALALVAPFDHFLFDSFVGFVLVALAFGFFALHQKSDS